MPTHGKYKSFSDLPQWAQTALREFWSDVDRSVHAPIPALNGMSFMAVINSGPDGEQRAREYIRTVRGKFFDGPDTHEEL